MKKIKLAFSDIVFDKHNIFDKNKNLFIDLLSRRFDLQIVEPSEADVLIYSDFGNEHRSFLKKKIYYTAENMLPNFDECDYALTFCHLPENPRHCRMPFYIWYVSNPEQLLKKNNKLEHNFKFKFCNMVVTNPKGVERNKFFRLLNRRKQVDSGGKHFNNIGYQVENKVDFIKDYKFTMAFENSKSDGYTTEKIIESMIAGSIPIYWGNSKVALDFNPKSFIDVSNFPTYKDAVNHILEVDSNDELYRAYLDEPWFNQDVPSEWFNYDKYADTLERFINEPCEVRQRIYTDRKLREHALGSPLVRMFNSLWCRIESLIWRIQNVVLS
jgi:hypothetical protein